MTRTLTPDEARDIEIAERTERRLADWRQKLVSRDPRAMTDLQNVILDQLSADDAKALLAKAATEPGSQIHFEQLVARYMADQCEVEAIREVEEIERRRPVLVAEDRVSIAMYERAPFALTVNQ